MFHNVKKIVRRCKDILVGECAAGFAEQPRLMTCSLSAKTFCRGCEGRKSHFLRRRPHLDLRLSTSIHPRQPRSANCLLRCVNGSSGSWTIGTSRRLRTARWCVADGSHSVGSSCTILSDLSIAGSGPRSSVCSCCLHRRIWWDIWGRCNSCGLSRGMAIFGMDGQSSHGLDGEKAKNDHGLTWFSSSVQRDSLL